MSYASFMSYANYISYANIMSYVCKLYELYEVCKLYEVFLESIKNCLKPLEFVLNITFFDFNFFKKIYISRDNAINKLPGITQKVS